MISAAELQNINPEAAKILPIKTATWIGLAVLLFSGVGCLVWLWQFWLRRNRILVRLVQELEQYHQFIQNIDVLDQLQEAGNPVALSDRDRVIAALRSARSQLVRALKTEKILRDNPQFQKFQLNGLEEVVMVTALQIGTYASQIGQEWDESLQIAIEVQEEMRQL